ncbi:hypothetical protein KFZ70_03365 [Tamlana fucoidanivorans]|uniref:Cytochrome C oxidase subunit I n=1 Tax=Allotamlana fucoidanivorans TaxID=2583814 RepID=A0A5C4SK06_9FLAO|nr:hypothetical protein [Tamlana fucoidanivorans]TNJ44266.1 hypothetical protein FGF67_09555 [Tamlana fucoidanivorans]
MKQKYFVAICLFNFFVAALMGLLLRYTYLGDIHFNYRFLTHAHSHVAMLGWVYLLLYSLFVHHFIPEKRPVYYRLFWLTQLAVMGMMLSFPFQGYASISIAFSTLHIFCSYYFSYLFFKNAQFGSVITKYLTRTSLVFMLISTIGVWCLGPAVTMLGNRSAFYQIAIQFFLHFQFNGWFIIAVLTVLFHVLEVQDVKLFRPFLGLLVLSTILSLALPVHWFLPHPFLIKANIVAVLLQLIMLFLFLKIIKPYQKALLASNSKTALYVFGFSVFCFLIKIGMQLTVLSPKFAEEVFQHRNFVIGFIHLTMLGVISGFLLFFIIKNQWVASTALLKGGVLSFVLGFVLTEIILLIQGYKYFTGTGIMENYYVALFLFSMLIPIGVLVFLIQVLRNNH